MKGNIVKWKAEQKCIAKMTSDEKTKDREKIENSMKYLKNK